MILAYLAPLKSTRAWVIIHVIRIGKRWYRFSNCTCWLPVGCMCIVSMFYWSTFWTQKLPSNAHIQKAVSKIKKTKSIHPRPLMKKLMSRQFLAVTKQLYEWLRPSVRLSVRHTFLTMFPCSYQFSGVITNDRSDVHAKGQGHRWKVKVTEVITQLRRFRTVTPVWINIWWWNDAYSLMLLRRGAPLIVLLGHPSNFKVTRLKLIVDFEPNFLALMC